MRISYRQGLISAQADFLQIGQTDSRYVDLIVSPTPTIAALASGNVDYLIGEYKTVSNAWGPFDTALTYYLYWEINAFGKVGYGSTTVSPVSASTEPVKIIDQMWWDTTANEYKVWNGTHWIKSIRVLAGVLRSGGILVPSGFISQVGLNLPVEAGFILTDSFGNVFKDNAGNFLTTSTPITSSDTGSLVKLDGAQILVQANENIPKFSLVYLIGGRAALASGTPPDNLIKAPIGIVSEDAYQNDVINIIPAGKTISNDQWSYAPSTWGKPVYCGNDGEIILNKPSTQKNLRVGTIISAQSILLNFDWETEAAVAADGISGVAASAPMFISGSPNLPVVNMPRATELVDGFMNNADFARIPALEVLVANKSNVGHGHIIQDVSGLQAALDLKTPFGHGHVIADVANLQVALDNKANTVHTHVVADITDIQPIFINLNTAINSKIPKISGGVPDNFASILANGTIADSNFSATSFALAIHSHTIASIIGLQGALDLKANLGHIHTISDVSGLASALDGKAPLIHSHIIADVTGLQTALDGKASVLHLHAIADVSGLQTALNGKAALIHTHAIADVIGLQTALDGKSPVIHLHAINEVAGLQLELNNKADINHTHVAADITDFQDASYVAAKTIFTTNTEYAWFEADDVAHTMTLNIANNLGSVSWPIVSPNGAAIEEGRNGSGALILRGKSNTSVTLAVGGNSVNDPGPSAKLELTAASELKINNAGGSLGQVLTSGGTNSAIGWMDIPTPPPAALPAHQIGFGDVNSIVSSANLLFDVTSNSLYVNGAAAAAPVASGNIYIGTQYAESYQTDSSAAGTITFAVNNYPSLSINSYGEFRFCSNSDPSSYTEPTSPQFLAPDGIDGGFTFGNGFDFYAGKAAPSDFYAAGGAINFYAGNNFNGNAKGASIEIEPAFRGFGGYMVLKSGGASYFDQSQYPGTGFITSGDIVLQTDDIDVGPPETGADLNFSKTGDIHLQTGIVADSNGTEITNRIGNIYLWPGQKAFFGFSAYGEIYIDNTANGYLTTGNAGDVLTSSGPKQPVSWQPLPTLPQQPPVKQVYYMSVTQSLANPFSGWTDVHSYENSQGVGTYEISTNAFTVKNIGIHKVTIKISAVMTDPWPATAMAYGSEISGTYQQMFGDTDSVYARMPDTTGTVPTNRQKQTWQDEYTFMTMTPSSTFTIAPFMESNPTLDSNVSLTATMTVEFISGTLI